MSDVEKLYARMQVTFGGNVPWVQLHLQQQYDFVNAVNAIVQICQSNFSTKGE